MVFGLIGEKLYGERMILKKERSIMINEMRDQSEELTVCYEMQ